MIRVPQKLSFLIVIRILGDNDHGDLQVDRMSSSDQQSGALTWAHFVQVNCPLGSRKFVLSQENNVQHVQNSHGSSLESKPL